MNLGKNLRMGAAATIVLTAATSLAGNITIANADNINKTGVVNTLALNVRKGLSTKNGIVTKIYKGDKVTITDSSNGWYNVKLSDGTTISKSNLKVGDLVFFNTNGSGVSHVGIYIGNGNMIHSTKPGDVVKTTSINSSYYKNKFVTAKRYL